MSEQPAPLSEEALAGMNTAPRLADVHVLVAEVRRLRTRRLAEAAADISDLVKLKAAHDAEVARLRGLLREHGGHKSTCPAGRTVFELIHGWLGGACTCGWAAIERELAGEEAKT